MLVFSRIVLPPSALSSEEREYLHSDYLTESEAETEAEVPVPDRLLPKRKYQAIVAKLKLSQRIGLLLWLNRNGTLSIGGSQRLLYLQEKASFEAISAGLKFAERLSKDKKLQSDFMHAARELNRRPQSKRFRIREVRRIGVGYRDKGTLPVVSTSARRKAQEENFVSTLALPEELVQLVRLLVPSALVEDEEWVDLQEVTERLRSSFPSEEIHSLLNPL